MKTNSLSNSKNVSGWCTTPNLVITVDKPKLNYILGTNDWAFVATSIILSAEKIESSSITIFQFWGNNSKSSFPDALRLNLTKEQALLHWHHLLLLFYTKPNLLSSVKLSQELPSNWIMEPFHQNWSKVIWSLSQSPFSLGRRSLRVPSDPLPLLILPCHSMREKSRKVTKSNCPQKAC